MAEEKQRGIWVLPELSGKPEEISKLGCGLLSEARSIAEKVNGTVTALALGDRLDDFSAIFHRYGVSRAYIFEDPLLKYYSAEAYFTALQNVIRDEKPWLLLMGDTVVGRELGPRLAAFLETGTVSGCVRIDLSDIQRPKFFRPVYGGQAYQGVVFQSDRTMIVTMDPEALNNTPCHSNEKPQILFIKPALSPEAIRVEHLEFLPSDFKTVDVADAGRIVAAGMGAATADLLPLVEELASLVEGSIGTTRPVVDEGKISRERMIGQTGKVVSPDFYLALGISGATHHVGGIQDSKTIVSVNRDPQAPIFQSSDVGIIAELKDVLPRLIEKLKQAKQDGEIL